MPYDNSGGSRDEALEAGEFLKSDKSALPNKIIAFRLYKYKK